MLKLLLPHGSDYIISTTVLLDSLLAFMVADTFVKVWSLNQKKKKKNTGYQSLMRHYLRVTSLFKHWKNMPMVQPIFLKKPNSLDKYPFVKCN